MKELSIRRSDPAKMINEVAYNLDKVSKLYGYKLPGPQEAKSLVEFVVKNFAFLSPNDIQKAFEMVALNKLNVEIEAYGRILVVPIITKVLRAFQIHKNKLNQVDEDRGLKGEERIQANKEARLFLLNQMKEVDLKVRLSHYNLIDQYIERFPTELKVETYQEEIQKEKSRLKALKPVTRAESISIRNLLTDNQMIDSTAKINAQIRLANEYIFGSEIDFEEIERRINNDIQLDRID